MSCPTCLRIGNMIAHQKGCMAQLAGRMHNAKYGPTARQTHDLETMKADLARCADILEQHRSTCNA